ncbi:MAG: hypothetical protein DRI01_10275 [Chloroflexi bacterium]|nr:MAG: hypothetical protein DRI01_10275 [Chloroflexota bacterium]
MKLSGYKRILSNIAVVMVLLLATVMALPLAAPVEAHMPGAEPAPEFELEPIVISDGGRQIQITIEDVGSYHNECEKEFKTQMLRKQGKTEAEIARIIEEEFGGADGLCPCSSFAFRAASLGISQVWGDEIPERGDIKVISHRPTIGATQCLQYITGTGPKVPNVTNKGELHLILPDGTEAIDLSTANLMKLKKQPLGMESWNLIIIRKSTGEEFEVQARGNVFPQDFNELRTKKMQKTATPEEEALFGSQWAGVRDAFLTQPDWVLFEGIEEPEEPLPTAAIAFSSVLIVAIIVGFIYSARGRRR